jgi:hypothetical protein
VALGVGLIFVLTSVLIGLLGFGYGWLIASLIFPLGFGSLNRIALVETMSWNWNRFWTVAIPGSIVGLIFGLIGQFWSSRGLNENVLLPGLSGEVLLAGLIVGLSIGLVGGFTDRVKVGKAFPNQGIKLSAKNSLTAFLVTLSIGGLGGLIVGCFAAPERHPRTLIGEPHVVTTLIFGLIYGLIVALIVGLNRGGSAVIKHYALRLILWLNGCTPFRFVNFIDHCAKLVLLKKVGGGYIFIHRMLLEYFADLTTDRASATATSTQDSEKPF